jgi:hypothetical protein
MSDKTWLAYAIHELPFGRTIAYKEITAGRLRAVKMGQRTFILADDMKEYLAGLPVATSETMRAMPWKRRVAA